MSLSNQAVAAAARVLYAKTRALNESDIRAALEAAAPHMLAEAKADAWDVGYMCGREDESSTHVPFMAHTQTHNPYRPTP